MHVWGRRAKETNAGLSDGRMPAWLANNTHVGSKGTQQAPHGWKQGRDHSLAAESGGIQMHVWGRAKENKAGLSEGTCQHSQPTTHMG